MKLNALNNDRLFMPELLALKKSLIILLCAVSSPWASRGFAKAAAGWIPGYTIPGIELIRSLV